MAWVLVIDLRVTVIKTSLPIGILWHSQVYYLPIDSPLSRHPRAVASVHQT